MKFQCMRRVFCTVITAAIILFTSRFGQADVKASGWNVYGQLGNGTYTNSNVLVNVKGLSGVLSIAGGAYHSLAVKTDGTVWTWGTDTVANSSAPAQVTGLSGVAGVAGGVLYSLAVKTDGTVWAWGRNNEGELGNGTTTDSSVPVQVTGLSGVVAVASGNFHSLAVKADGTLWAWGYNNYGQLGNGTTATSNVPVLVTSLTGVVAVTGGWYHSLAVKSDGTVWAWGANYYGQLGNGTTTDSSVPVRVPGLSGVAGVASGYGHNLALKKDGTVWVWGYNYEGELGNGTNSESIVPVQVTGLSGVVAVACGALHSLAVKADGTVWAWGHNEYGQLGNGKNTNSNVPVYVTSLTGVVKVAGGFGHSLATAIGSTNLSSGIYDTFGKPVKGIVCDNLKGMDATQLNFLKVILPSDFNSVTSFALTDTASPPNNAIVGTMAKSGTNLIYTPPLEFNRKPAITLDDVTPEATRKVHLSVVGKRKDGTVITGDADIVLARPPVVLVHGINSGPDNWWDLAWALQHGAGKRFAFTKVDHSDLVGGKGPVEVGAMRVQRELKYVTDRIRSGQPIIQSIADESPDGSNTWKDFTDYSQVGPLAIRRADVVAWSYGGVLTRWYLKSDGSDPSLYHNPTKPWYQDLAFASQLVDTELPSYQRDVRKVITLGSMWRGVGLINYINEAILGNSIFSPNPKMFGNSPVFLPFSTSTINLFDFFNSIALLRGPAFEVMGVESRWLRWLIYGGSTTATPFIDSVAYSSVAGTNNLYLVGVIEPYKFLNGNQYPSWFPFIPLDIRKDSPGSTPGITDGIVPIWSSAIPGKGNHHLTNDNHSDYAKSLETQTWVATDLSNSSLKLGKDLNTTWNLGDFTVNGAPNGRALNEPFKVQQGKIAPYPWSDIYRQVYGAARLSPTAYYPSQSIKDTLRLEKTAIRRVPLAAGGSNIEVDLKLTNTGWVLVPSIALQSPSLSASSVLPRATYTAKYKDGLPAAGFTLEPDKTWVLPGSAEKEIKFTLRFDGTLVPAGTLGTLKIKPSLPASLNITLTVLTLTNILIP